MKILAEMIRSALDWETENGIPCYADQDGQKEVDGIPGAYILFTISAPREYEKQESGEA